MDILNGIKDNKVRILPSVQLFNLIKLKIKLVLPCDQPASALKAATSWFAHLEKFSLNFSSLPFVIRVNLLHPLPSLFLYGLVLSLWCFSILLNYYFQVSFNSKAILSMAKITHD